MNDRFCVTLNIRRGMFVFLFLLFSSQFSDAQSISPLKELTSIPSGLTLPIEIHRGVKAAVQKPDKIILGTTTQAVLVSHDRYLPAGTKLVGTVVESAAMDGHANRSSKITIRFHHLEWRGQSVPIVVKVIAIANFTEVKHTLMPANGSGDLKSGVTFQVGGDLLYRTGGAGELLDRGMQHIGFADGNGVFAEPVGEKGIPLALGVFSTSAHGLYGFDETAKLESAGGEMTVTSSRRLVLRSGDDLLLETLPAR